MKRCDTTISDGQPCISNIINIDTITAVAADVVVHGSQIDFHSNSSNFVTMRVVHIYVCAC